MCSTAYTYTDTLCISWSGCVALVLIDFCKMCVCVLGRDIQKFLEVFDTYSDGTPVTHGTALLHKKGTRDTNSMTEKSLLFLIKCTYYSLMYCLLIWSAALNAKSHRKTKYVVNNIE